MCDIFKHRYYTITQHTFSPKYHIIILFIFFKSKTGSNPLTVFWLVDISQHFLIRNKFYFVPEDEFAEIPIATIILYYMYIIYMYGVSM